MWHHTQQRHLCTVSLSCPFMLLPPGLQNLLPIVQWQPVSPWQLGVPHSQGVTGTGCKLVKRGAQELQSAYRQVQLATSTA